MPKSHVTLEDIAIANECIRAALVGMDRRTKVYRQLRKAQNALWVPGDGIESLLKKMYEAPVAARCT